MENRGISNSKPRASYERNLAYLKSWAAQKILVSQLPCTPVHDIELALRRSNIAEQKKRMKQHNSMKKPFKAKALLAIVVQPLATPGSNPRLTTGSKRSLRSLGRAEARPLTKR